MSLLNLSIKEYLNRLSAKEISCVQLVKEFAEQVKKFEKLNSFITWDLESATKSASNADARRSSGTASSLEGLPIAYKDMILTKGMRTTAASRMLSDFVPPYNAHVVEKLEGAGAVNFGKTNQDEFAMGSSSEHSHFGTVLNPWDNARVAGGSSGGSAAAVAARMVPVALGTDTGGSVRQPAAFCGIVGFKPTYGRISRYGVIAYASSLDQVGIFSKTVADSAEVFNVIAGHDSRDSTSSELAVPTMEEMLDQKVLPLKIGIASEYFSDGIDPEVRTAVESAIDKLRGLGAELVPVHLPHTNAAIATYYIIAPAEASSNLCRYDGVRFGHRAENCKSLEQVYRRSRSEGFGVEVQRRILTGSYVLSKGYYDAYYRKAQRIRRLIKEDFDAAFESCDLIISPTTPTTAFEVGACLDNPVTMYLNDVFTVPINLAGLPALSLPVGLDSKGLPIGAQLIGPNWGESRLLSVANLLEKEIGFNACPSEVKELL